MTTTRAICGAFNFILAHELLPRTKHGPAMEFSTGGFARMGATRLALIQATQSNHLMNERLRGFLTSAWARFVITGIGVRTDRRGGLVYAGYTRSI
jgi:hypothetical protein